MEEQTPVAQSPQPQSSSKKFLILGVVVFLLAIVGVAGYLIMGMGSKQIPADQTKTANSNAESQQSIITSIKDALSSAMSLQCEFTDEDTNTKTVAYIKAGAIRTDFTGKNADESGSAIMKNNTMYFWNGKEGMTMKFDFEKLAQETQSTLQNQTQNPNEIIESLEKYKKSCKQATVSDALFVPPSDVTFTDLSAYMNESMKAIPSITKDQEITKEKVEELQKMFEQ